MLALAIPMMIFYVISILIGCASSAASAARRAGERRGRSLAAVADVAAPTATELVARYDFALDRFQLEALDALDAGQSVLVAAPTGSGKTVVAEYAIDAALADGRRAFYTAPIKALSNQKYHDLVRAPRRRSRSACSPATTRSTATRRSW